MVVYNMTSPKTGNPVANQFIISEKTDKSNRLIFQSYKSKIIDIDFFNSTITFGEDWNYSRTTAKYRNEFLNEYFPQLADTKKLKALEQVVRANNGQIEMQLGITIYTIKFEQ